MSFLLYILTALATFFGITTLPAVLIGGLISRISGRRSGIFTGCLVSWFLIDFIWRMATGHHITILALAISILIFFIIDKTQSISEDSKTIMGGEFFAILTLVGVLAYKGMIIWY